MEYYYIYNGQIGLYPTPSTSGNVITISGKIRPTDLNLADITTSTITTLANDTTALTVSAGLTAQMVGYWIRPTFSTTANKGDGQWYEIATVTSGTAGTLVRKYGGVSIAVGTAACTIAQVPLLPEVFHDLPVYMAAATYWYKEGDNAKADRFMAKYERDKAILETKYSSFLTNVVLDDGSNTYQSNPNLTVEL